MNKLSEKIITTTKKATEKYSEMSMLRAVINGIPFIGGPIDVFLSSEGQKIVQDRTMHLIECLKYEMQDFDEKTINNDFLESEEFFDLIIKTFDTASKERDRTKISVYAKIMKHSIEIEEVDSSVDYISAISELSIDQFLVAKEIYDQQKQHNLEDFETPLLMVKDAGWDEISNIIIEKYDINIDDIPFILKRIEKTGLIMEITGTYWDYTGGAYIITTTFRKIMSILKNI